jgi:hypothetical protein
VSENESGNHARFTITNAYINSTNSIYIRKIGEEFSDTPNLVIEGNGTDTYTLGVGLYYAKVTSVFNNLMALGKTDPVKFSVAIPVTSDEVLSPPEPKNILTVQQESITNTFFGNQFVGYFLKIPQVGYYQDAHSKSLRSYYVDRINESIRGIRLPDINTTMIALSYFGHQNDYKMGVGDGELGHIGVQLKLDKFLNNYTTFINWQYCKYDWTFGGKNPINDMKKQMDLEGIIVVDFIDSTENISRQIGYKVIIDSVPGLSLTTSTPEEIDFEISLRITDIDIEKFVMGHPLSDKQRIL